MSQIPNEATVFTDFDGTITTSDVAEAILEHYTGKDWWRVEEEFRNGRIGSREAIVRQFQLIESTREEILDFVDGFEIDPHFEDFVELLSARGQPLVVLSEGLDFYIEHILRKNGLELDVYSNRVDFNHHVNISFPHEDSECRDCGVCKTAIMRRFPGPRVYIGDGYSDRCPAQQAADVVFAKGNLARYCDENHVPFVPFNDFGDIINSMEEWE